MGALDTLLAEKKLTVSKTVTPTATKQLSALDALLSKQNIQATTTEQKLPSFLGGGQYNATTDNSLIKDNRGYAGIEAPGQYREHIFPVALGGTSNSDNIKVYGKDLGAQKTAYETNIINQYHAGKLSLPEARGLVLKKYREITGMDQPTSVSANFIPALKETLSGIGSFLANKAKGLLGKDTGTVLQAPLVTAPAPYRSTADKAIERNVALAQQEAPNVSQLELRKSQGILGPAALLGTPDERLANKVEELNNRGIIGKSAVMQSQAEIAAEDAFYSVAPSEATVGKEKLATVLLGQKSPLAIESTLINAGIPQDLAKIYSEKFAKTSSQDEISKGIDSLRSAVADTKMAPVIPKVEAPAQPVSALDTLMAEKKITPLEVTKTVAPVVETKATKINLAPLKEEKKALIHDYLQSPEGQKLASDASQLDFNKEAAKSIDKRIVQGIKNNPIVKKEGTMNDLMGSGYLMERTTPIKGGGNVTKYVVAEPDLAKTLVEKGWTKGSEIDTLAQEAGYDNGLNFLQKTLDTSNQAKGAKIKLEQAAHENLLKTSPYYKELNNTITSEAAKNAALKNEITYSPIKDVISSTPEIKTSKLGLGVEAKAIEKKLTQGFEGLPEYAKVNVKQQAEAANELVKNRLNEAIDIARGNRLPPEGILPEAVFTAVEQHALKTGDIQLLNRLAKSKLVTEATGMGQRIRLLAERNPDSPVASIRKVIENRAKYFESKTGKTVNEARRQEVKKLKESIKKVLPKRDEWTEFVESIKC